MGLKEYRAKRNFDKTPEPTSAKKKSKSKMPGFITPMLATLVSEPFTDDEWLFEIKWDGYRVLAYVDDGKVDLISRNNKNWTKNFHPIASSLEKIDRHQVILDGEVVILDKKGRSDFQLMQNYQSERSGALYYYVFDILFLDGEDLRDRPLMERKEILKEFLEGKPLASVRLSDYVLQEGERFFEEVSKARLEGMIGKRLASTYQSKRSRDWVKVKTIARQEVVICGFTVPRGSRTHFGALIVAVYNDKQELVYAGRVGGGFNGKLLKQIYDKLQPLVIQKSPLKNPPREKDVTWVKPQYVCEVAFSEWTKEGIMRQPIFQGLRSDKKPEVIKKEEAIPTEEEVSVEPAKKAKKGQKVVLTHLDKIYWPDEKYTKGDLIEYYREIAPYILPYLKDRPIVLHRYPDGISGEQFYHKNIDVHPSWVKTFPITSDGKTIRYLLIDDVDSLLYAVNLGSIDIHPFMSQTESLDYPDYCVIDLDPHDVPFKSVVEVAKAYHQLLTELKVKHYCKTSGGKGLHILIPLHAEYTYEQSRQFAEIISHFIRDQFPKITSLERITKKRANRIYLDCLQNRPGQTIAAPYSARPRVHATVSTPLEWDEIDDSLNLQEFNIKTVPARVKKKGDIFGKKILKEHINMDAILKKIEKRT